MYKTDFNLCFLFMFVCLTLSFSVKEKTCHVCTQVDNLNLKSLNSENLEILKFSILQLHLTS